MYKIICISTRNHPLFTALSVQILFKLIRCRLKKKPGPLLLLLANVCVQEVICEHASCLQVIIVGFEAIGGLLRVEGTDLIPSRASCSGVASYRS